MSSSSVTPLPAAARYPLWQRLLARVGVDYLAVAVFLAIFAQLFFIYGATVHLLEGSVIWPSVVLLVIIATRFFTRLHTASGDAAARRAAVREALVIARDWVPLILLILVYENLRGLTGKIRPDDIDHALWAADVAIFGVEPTLWIQRFINPWLTDYFAFAYMLYFILPLALATALYVKGKRDDFRELTLGVLLVQYVGFLLYITFPAGPPRFLITTYDPPRLTGALGLFELTHGAYDRLNQVKHHSSFPSLHCALSLTALLFAWRFRKVLGVRWFWAILPFTVSLWISVVYLRHHWIVDAFAGWALGLAVFFVTPIIRRRYASFRARVLPVERADDLQAAA